MVDAPGDDQKVPGTPALALFRPWFVGQLTVVPFLVGLWLPRAGLSLKWSLWVGVGAAVLSFVVLGVVVERRGKRRAGAWFRVLSAPAPEATQGGRRRLGDRPAMVARAVWALLKVLFVAVELVVLGFVGWLALREVFSTLGWTGVDALMVAVVVCVAVALVGLTSSSWGRSAASVRPSSAVPYTWKPSAMANLFVGLAVAVLVWGSVVAALAWGGLGEVIDPVGAPSGWSLPVGIGLLVCAVLVVPWLFWAGDYSRHVDQDAPRGSVTGWVALGGALPSVVLMVAGIVIASRQEVPDHLLGYVDLFGHLDALSWGWAIVVPLTLALLATVYLRAAAIPAAVRTA